ncbi:hypothetical protein [Nostoc sp. UIC 10630]|uniref:hypothetical protein n=1 Tax=Nostoc sp. UIC 10630 TaxID=2100146 RepID=UPI0013D8B91D|nr:hypothetical protein [Nostoc sp. UIC 10630]NEU83880.1 hypothetical protein [Nostoc sp. UIC 10630]
MQIALLLFLVQAQHIVDGINLKDATHSRFPRRYHQSRILKLHPRVGAVNSLIYNLKSTIV